MLPTLGFGIPGSAEMAVLLGAFILHGLTPGPMLIKEHLDIVWALILGMTLAALLASFLGILASKYIVKISRINVSYIIPVVGAICLVGAFAYRGSILDVLLAVIFGFLGFGLKTFGFPIIPLVMGHVLGQMAEVYFNQSLMISDIGYQIFFTRYISLGFFIATVIVLVLPFVKDSLRKGAGD
jgi:putative tricarboxylic transport membrane protein